MLIVLHKCMLCHLNSFTQSKHNHKQCDYQNVLCFLIKVSSLDLLTILLLMLNLQNACSFPYWFQIYGGYVLIMQNLSSPERRAHISTLSHY